MENLRLAFEAGVETNDLIWAGYAMGLYNTISVTMGERLEAMMEKMKIYSNFSRQSQIRFSHGHSLALSRLAISLRGNQPADLQLQGEYADIEKQIPYFKDFAAKSGVYLPLTTFYLFNGAQHYYFKHFEEAYENLELAIPIVAGIKGLPSHGELIYYHSLSIAALLLKGSNEAENLLQKIADNQAVVNNWAQHSPDNFKAKYLLVEALLAQFRKQHNKAANLFTEAIDAASIGGLTHLSALVYERMAEYYFSRGLKDLASVLIRNAWLYYREWGADAKVQALEAEYPQLQSARDPRPGIGLLNNTSSISSIDLESIFKASTSISGEVIFDNLLEKLLKIVIENAGAQSGSIIMERGGRLIASASGDTEDGWKCTQLNLPIETVEDIPHAIIQVVYHTSETLILNDAVNDVRFSTDPYIARVQPKSVLCLPVLQHGRCLAILYLQNNLATNAFTPARLEILNLLSGQIAISLDNAELYRNLEEKVRERTDTIENQKIQLEQEKEKSDTLLLNILPSEVAEELKNKGSYKPRRYDNVSIMFSDFEGFTMLSEKLSTEELVEMVDECYQAFDLITTRHGIEKIKTIGDAYMCVSGLPVINNSHAVSAVSAALEMLSFIEDF